MFSGTPPVTYGRGRGRGRGLPLYQFRRMLPKLGNQFFDHPHHLTRPHRPTP
ncbi:UNVERIFIED_CONTAM: hypothetical protein Sindi_1812700, partial [Sesamum indicum]